MRADRFIFLAFVALCMFIFLCKSVLADEVEMEPIMITGVPHFTTYITVESKGVQRGSFSYRIPKLKISRVIEVDAGIGGDVEGAILDGMIKEIASDRGRDDFVFDSPDNGLTTLNAINGESELRRFLKREFFR